LGAFRITISWMAAVSFILLKFCFDILRMRWLAGKLIPLFV
jgi:hypothetical protein